jgi:hypothetical protein
MTGVVDKRAKSSKFKNGAVGAKDSTLLAMGSTLGGTLSKAVFTVEVAWVAAQGNSDRDRGMRMS